MFLFSYRHTWKSRHNHFLRHSDVKPRESPRPTVNELAGQKYIKQKINGWKIYHLTSQMGDVIDMETELTSRLSQLQKKLDKHALNEVNKDVSKIQELIKANLQRSKVIQVIDCFFSINMFSNFSTYFSHLFFDPLSNRAHKIFETSNDISNHNIIAMPTCTKKYVEC